MVRRVLSQPVFSGESEGPFSLSCTFIFRNERNWIKKSARVSEKLVSSGLPSSQVATRLVVEVLWSENNLEGTMGQPFACYMVVSETINNLFLK